MPSEQAFNERDRMLMRGDSDTCRDRTGSQHVSKSKSKSKSKTWDEMEPRERNEVIAVKVFGWVKPKRRHIGETWYSPEDWGSSVDSWPNYTTDTSADYLVLVKMRETDEDRFFLFLDLMNHIWKDRFNNDEQFGNQELWSCYLPGDYSHAAFLAVNGAST